MSRSPSAACARALPAPGDLARARQPTSAVTLLVIAVLGSGCASQSLRQPLSEAAAEPTLPTTTRSNFVPTSALANQYWEWRVSYPTGQFQGRWLVAAAKDERAMARSLPETRFAKRAGSAASAAGLLNPLQATELGPQPLNWGTASLPYGTVGGRTNVLLAHPSNAAVAWLGSDGGGIWKTTNCCDANTVWRATTDLPELSNIAIGALALDPSNPDILYAGTGDFRRNRPFTFGAGGLLRSTDGGDSWVVLGADVFNPVYTQAPGLFPQYRAISAVAVDPRASHRLAVGTNQGIYLSQDSGQNWTGPCFTNAFTGQRQDVTGLIAQDIGGSTVLTVAIGAMGRNSTVRADLRENGANGIYRTTMPSSSACPPSWALVSRPDNGWPVGSGSGLPFYQAGGNPLRRIDLAAAPSNPNVIYAQVESEGVWRTGNGGLSWVKTASQPADFSQGCVNDSYGNGMLFQSYNAGLLVSPSDPDTVFLSSTDIWRSTNGGQSFRNLSCGYDETAPGVPGTLHVDNHARAFVAGDANRLLVGHDGGVHYSADALSPQPSFLSLNESLGSIEFYSGALSAGFNDRAYPERYIGGGAQDNGASNVRWGAGQVPAVAEWTLRSGGDGIDVQFDPVLGQRWYYSSQFLFIFASTTGYDGAADVQISPPDGWAGDRRGFLAPFRLYTHGDANTCPPTLGCQRMIAGTYRVWEHMSGGIPSSRWLINSPDLTKQLSAGSDLSIINTVEYLPGDPSRAFVGTNDGNVWFGHGLGQGVANSASWVDLTGRNMVLPNRPIMDLVPDPADPRRALVGLAGFDQNTPSTPGRVYRVSCSDDICSSFSWSDRSGNLPNIPVNAVFIDPNRPSQAYAGTDWGLYFTLDLDATPVQWQRFAGGLPPAMVWDLVSDRGATTLAIFTRSRGAWVWPLNDRAFGVFGDGFEGL